MTVSQPRTSAVGATSRIVSAAIAVAALAWLWLLLGLVYARFFVAEPAPNVVITFSDNGLARLFAELISLGIGCLGFVLTLVLALARRARGCLPSPWLATLLFARFVSRC
jgi:hypothetical protein